MNAAICSSKTRRSAPKGKAPSAHRSEAEHGVGHCQFHSIAMDNAGNVEAALSQADAGQPPENPTCHRKLFTPEKSYIPG